jgi:hypothetical protein
MVFTQGAQACTSQHAAAPFGMKLAGRGLGQCSQTSICAYMPSDETATRECEQKSYVFYRKCNAIAGFFVGVWVILSF